MQLDRTKQAMAAFVLSQMPQVDYLASYGGVVVSQGGPNAFDFQPDDQRIPGHSGIPIKLPFPGFALTLDTSKTPRALLGWAGGDPSKPELRLWEAPGLSALVVTAEEKISLVGQQVNIGGDPGSDAQLKGTSFFADAVTPFVTATTVFQQAITAFTEVLTTYQQGIQPTADVQNSFTGPAVLGNQALAAAAEAMSAAAQDFQAAVEEALSTIAKVS